MPEKKAHHKLFNKLASFYGLYFESQKRSFNAAINIARPMMDLSEFNTVLDVGCGTGALCSVLADRGFLVTGVEPAKKMLAVAVNKTKSQGISLISGNVLKGLPFEDKSFDIVTASFVAHGLVPEHRKIMFAEMSRVAKHYVIFHDFNQNRSLQISLLEWLEGGDYFRFIKTARQEMQSCETQAGKCFSEVKVINVEKHVDWYICRPIPMNT